MAELSEKQIKELKQVFDIFDKDGSGTISIVEFKELFNKLNLITTEEQLDNFVNFLDIDGDGQVNFEEFLRAFAEKMHKKFTKREIREAFDFFDKDNDDYIELEELEYVLKRLGKSFTRDNVAKVFESMDRDHNGRISFEEFARLFED